MIDVLLVNPPSDLERSYGRMARVQVAQVPMGIAYLAAVLEKHQVSVAVIDAYALGVGLTTIRDTIAEHRPKIVGFSCLTPNAPIVYQMTQAIKEQFPWLIVVMGNTHPSVFAAETLREGFADVIVHGEGEYSLLELTQAILGGAAFDSIKGISYREVDSLRHNPPRERILNLDELPFPARHLLPMTRYHLAPHGVIKEPVATMLATRGCPNQCTFCSIGMGRRYRKRSPKNIVDEMEFLVKEYRVRQISFLDALFPLGKQFGKAVCAEIIQRGLQRRSIWTCETRVNAVDLELLEAMREAGCARIAFGIEAGSQQLLDGIKKGFTLEEVRQAVKYARQVGLSTVGLFMLGLPGETTELSRQTIDFALGLNLDFAKFNITVPYPGSELFEQAKGEGRIKLHDWSQFTSYPLYAKSEPVYVPAGMTEEELTTLQAEALRRFYLRPRLILRHLCQVRSLNASGYLAGLMMLWEPLWTKVKRLMVS